MKDVDNCIGRLCRRGNHRRGNQRRKREEDKRHDKYKRYTYTYTFINITGKDKGHMENGTYM